MVTDGCSTNSLQTSPSKLGPSKLVRSDMIGPDGMQCLPDPAVPVLGRPMPQPASMTGRNMQRHQLHALHHACAKGTITVPTRFSPYHLGRHGTSAPGLKGHMDLCWWARPDQMLKPASPARVCKGQRSEGQQPTPPRLTNKVSETNLSANREAPSK